MKIEFDKANHIYKVNGVERPSVNQILKEMGATPDFDSFLKDSYRRTLGEYVHQAIYLFLAGKLDEESLKGEVKDYFEGFRKFYEEHGFDPLEAETPLYSEKWGFCGTPDCFTKNTLYDWKVTENFYRHYYLAMGGYSILLEDNGYPITTAKLIFLKPGDYEIKEIEPDRQTFLAFLLAYKWKKGGRSGK